MERLSQHLPNPSAYAQVVECNVLGPLEVVVDGQRKAVGGPKQRAVLALLVADAGRPVSTSALIHGVYGDDASDRAHRSIHTFVSNLRGEVGHVVERKGDGYIFTADRSVVDAHRFEDIVREAADSPDSHSAVQLLREGLAMWRGHAYAELDGGSVLTTEITRLNELRVAATEARVEGDLHLGRHRELIAELDSLTAEYPLREGFLAQQMTALYRSGRQAEALRAYERSRNHLVNEMGLDPSPELRELERRILEHDPELGSAAGSSIRRVAMLVADVDDPRALAELAPIDRSELIARQSAAIDGSVAAHGGLVVAQRGSAVYATFSDAGQAVAAASEVVRALGTSDSQPLRIRVAIVVGEVETTNGEVSGPPIGRAAALLGAAHGGQVLLSSEAHQATADAGGHWLIRGLGTHAIRGLDGDQVVHQLVVDGMPTKHTTLRTEELPPSLPSQTIGVPGYELREEVGSGALGVVHLAYQPSVGREVAIKIVRPELANNAQFIRRFEVEAQLVARLEHPHIVPLYDYWRTPGGAYLVMRWVRGSTLEERISRHAMSATDVSSLLSQIGPALGYAHRHGVVHRDIKSSNLLLDEDNNAYLSDFGIAVVGGSTAEDVAALGRVLARCLPGAEGPVSDVIVRAGAGEYPDVVSLLGAWNTAFNGDEAGFAADQFTVTRNPYKGLHAFDESDSADFHGRSDEVAQLVSELQHNRLVAVVGPSGVGKSSVVRAGLIPALRGGAVEGSESWLVTDMIPGPYPFEELTSALMRVAVAAPTDLESELRSDERGLLKVSRRYLPEGAELFLLIDQFEELFTLVADDGERIAFLDLLRATVLDERSPVRVVVTMRADYFDRPLRFGDFGDLLRRSTVPLSAPAEAELREIVELPAAGVGVRFEGGLVGQVVGEAKDQPGALPLLEFSLTELFETRESDLLTLGAYRSSGGVLPALGRRAESTFMSLDAAGQEAAHQVFLRLVNVVESGRDTRRRVRVVELHHLGIAVDPVLATFGYHRLLSFDRDAVTRTPTVEVAHEALINQWPRLAGWISEQREDLLLHGRLAEAVSDWEASDRSTTYLLARGRLTQHEAWTTDTALTLTSEELEILQASRVAEDERLAKRRRARRGILAGFGVAAVVGLLLATAALVARNDAQDKTDLAEASRLATAAIDVLGDDPELALLLALTSATDGVAPGFETRRALHAAIDRNRAIASLARDAPDAWTLSATISPDGSMVMSAGEARAPAEMYRVTDTGLEYMWRADIPEEWTIESVFSADGTLLVASANWPVWDASVSETVFAPLPEPSIAGLYVFEAQTGELLDRPGKPDSCDAPYYPLRIAFSQLPAEIVGFCRGTPNWWVLDTSTWEISETHQADGALFSAQGTLDGSLVLMVSGSPGGQEVVALERSTGETFPIAVASPLTKYDTPVLSPSGTHVALGANLFDVRSGDLVHQFDADESLESCGLLPSFSSDGTKLFIGCEDGTTHVFNTVDGSKLRTLIGHTGWTAFATFNFAGDVVATGSADQVLRLWSLVRRPEVRSIGLGSGYHADAGIDVSGNVGAAVMYPTETQSPFHHFFSSMIRHAVGQLVIFDVQSGEVLRRIEGVSGKAARISPDGRHVIVQSATQQGVGDLVVYEIASGDLAYTLPGLCVGAPPFAAYAPMPECGELIAADATDLAWSPDGRFVAMAGGSSQRLLVWDTSDRSLKFKAEPLGTPGFAFSAVAFTDDGKTLAASSKTGMWIYDTATWNLVTPLIPHTGRPSWVMKFTSGGAELVTAQAHSGAIRIYDTTTWEHRDLKGGVGQTRDMAISSDESKVALASNDGNIHVIDLQTGDLLDLISLDDRDLTNIEFIDDDQRLLISATTGPVEIVTLDRSELMKIAESRISRSFTQGECDFYAINPCPTLEELHVALSPAG